MRLWGRTGPTTSPATTAQPCTPIGAQPCTPIGAHLGTISARRDEPAFQDRLPLRLGVLDRAQRGWERDGQRSDARSGAVVQTLADGVPVLRPVVVRVRLLPDRSVDICHPLRGGALGACGAAPPRLVRHRPRREGDGDRHRRCRGAARSACSASRTATSGERHNGRPRFADRFAVPVSTERSEGGSPTERSDGGRGLVSGAEALLDTAPRAEWCRVVRCRSHRLPSARAVLRGRALIVQRCVPSAWSFHRPDTMGPEASPLTGRAVVQASCGRAPVPDGGRVHLRRREGHNGGDEHR